MRHVQPGQTKKQKAKAKAKAVTKGLKAKEQKRLKEEASWKPKKRTAPRAAKTMDDGMVVSRLEAIEKLNKTFRLAFDLSTLPRVDGTDKIALKFVVPKTQINPDNNNPRRLVYVDPQKLEHAFVRSLYYIGQYGANPRSIAALEVSRQRVQNAFCYFRTGKPILVSICSLEGAKKDEVSFIDGKHRFCCYRDLGLRVIPLLVPVNQAKQFVKKFKALRKDVAEMKRHVRTVQPSKAGFTVAGLFGRVLQSKGSNRVKPADIDVAAVSELSFASVQSGCAGGDGSDGSDGRAGEDEAEL